MMLAIRRFPDPLLKQPTRTVARIDETVRRFIEELVRTMRSHSRCVGLAAPQVGSSLRIAVMDGTGHPNVSAGHGLLVLINPILEAAEGAVVGRECCLSVPALTANVRRATRVRLRALDQSGALRTITLDGFEAIIAQHEIDHLNGTLFLDRVANLKTDVFQRRKYS